MSAVLFITNGINKPLDQNIINTIPKIYTRHFNDSPATFIVSSSSTIPGALSPFTDGTEVSMIIIEYFAGKNIENTEIFALFGRKHLCYSDYRGYKIYYSSCPHHSLHTFGSFTAQCADKNTTPLITAIVGSKDQCTSTLKNMPVTADATNVERITLVGSDINVICRGFGCTADDIHVIIGAATPT